MGIPPSIIPLPQHLPHRPPRPRPFLFHSFSVLVSLLSNHLRTHLHHARFSRAIANCAIANRACPPYALSLPEYPYPYTNLPTTFFP